jgi:hypothetical protein
MPFEIIPPFAIITGALTLASGLVAGKLQSFYELLRLQNIHR